MDELAAHPTVKPVAMVADALKDCTRRGDIVLDTFAGAGTTILAAERVGRRAYSLELEPKYVDVAIRRWQAFTRRDAVHAATGQTFEDVADDRKDAQAAPSAPKSARARRRADNETQPPRRSAEDAPYEVGYCKPPKHTRFKPGQSGNRKAGPADSAISGPRSERRSKEKNHHAGGRPDTQCLQDGRDHTSDPQQGSQG